ncbi:MAG: hypothetical protein OEW19_07640 [Acidobacteriota bacterium]|nr:hypothetical protein [Acidobacteriota bacterium]
MTTAEAWSTAWRHREWRRTLASGLVLAALLTRATQAFFHVIEARAGTAPFDPLLHLVGPRDVAVATFVTLYGSILMGLALVLADPARTARLTHAYGMLLALRLLTMYIVPLEPPAGIIPLEDPITALFYPDRQPFLKDLFFSGHTATLTLLALAVGPGLGRRVLAAAAIGVGALLLVQHVHYTIDTVVAPLFAWLAWWLSAWPVRLCGASTDEWRAAERREL